MYFFQNLPQVHFFTVHVLFHGCLQSSMHFSKPCLILPTQFKVRIVYSCTHFVLNPLACVNHKPVSFIFQCTSLYMYNACAHLTKWCACPCGTVVFVHAASPCSLQILYNSTVDYIDLNGRKSRWLAKLGRTLTLCPHKI